MHPEGKRLNDLSERIIGAAIDVHAVNSPLFDDSGKVVGLLRDEDLLLTESNLHAPTAIEFLVAPCRPLLCWSGVGSVNGFGNDAEVLFYVARFTLTVMV
jgi:hypothetical protein